jgi:hypothetical protein
MSYNAPVENPYNSESQNNTPETLPLDEIIRRAIAAAMIKTRVMVPAKIVKVSGNQKVDVQITLKSRYVDGTVITIPTIQNVMVSMLVGQDWSIKVPLAVGDTGHLVFCDRSLDVWSASDGGVVDPQDSRTHDISDPIFVPGLVPFANQTFDTTTDMVLTNGKAKMRIQKAGTYTLSNGTVEVLDLMSQLLDTLINNTYTNTMIGPQPFIASTILLLNQLQIKLSTLKGS